MFSNGDPFDITVDLISDRYGLAADLPPALPMTDRQLQARDALQDRIDSGIYQAAWAPCLLCESHRFVVIAEKDRYNVKVQTCICQNCGLIQTNPRLGAQDYADFYETLYRELYTGTVDTIEAFFKGQRRAGKRILAAIGDLYEIGPGVRVLEVGTGAGGTLEELCKTGAIGLGLDLDKDYLRYGRQRWLNLQYGRIDDWSLAFRPDFVVYRHVLEHLLDPVGELRKIHQMGRSAIPYLFVEVPGIENIAGAPTRLRGDVLKTLQSAHICYFSKAQLANVLYLSGFKILKIDSKITALAARTRETKSTLKCHENWKDVLQQLRRFEQDTPVESCS